MFKYALPLLALTLSACQHSAAVGSAKEDQSEAPELGFASSCEYEAFGTSLPATSGSPAVIDDVTGTVIFANFFNSGAIAPPHFDGNEFVSVCVAPADGEGHRAATITSDVGSDNNFQIKAYPEFIVGTKFGNQFETSFRYYNTAGLPAKDKWPLVASGTDDNGEPFEFANLEYVSMKKEVGLPAFTSTLPEIFVTIDIDESNVVGSERDIMLESWFHDTSTNASLIGNNTATNVPIANTLNNIVGIGHRHYPQLDNTLLEMMVHIAPLSPHDVSQSQNNPGQNQLTEIYSGKDYDGDGIDDHFDVDSHAFINSTNPNLPSPGIYSSGIDNNSDGIDDADLLPVVIGGFAYSIWYGESVLAPIVIFSRETNRTLTNDFDPNTPDMDVSSEGEFVLPWHDFVDHTLYNVETSLQALNVEWAIGADNPFPQMRSLSGAISGVEFGVEPQINAPNDQPYELTINRYLVEVDGNLSGLLEYNDGVEDNIEPITTISTISPDNTGQFTFNGNATDTGGSGFKDVRLALRSTSLQKWYNFTNNSFSGAIGNGATSANLLNTTTAATDWSYSTPLPAGNYTIAVRTIDHASNASAWVNQSFSVPALDNQNPVTIIDSPVNDSTFQPGTITMAGTASDTGGSGFKDIRLALYSKTLQSWYNFSNNSFNGATGNGAISVTLSNPTTTATDWSHSAPLPPGDYAMAVRTIDNAGNSSLWVNRRFTVLPSDNQNPVSVIDTPVSDSILQPGAITVNGTASDTGGSGFKDVRIAIRSTSLQSWYNFSTNSFVGATGNGATSANLVTTSAYATEWNIAATLPAGEYTIAVRTIDKANNSSAWVNRSFIVQ